MKKFFIAAILSLLLLLSLSACGEQEPLRVLIDIAVTEADVSEVEWSGRDLLTNIKAAGGPEDIEIEYLPVSGPERDAALTRIRTEVMAGEGPDVFLVNYHTDVDEVTGQKKNTSLFLFPEKAMKNGLFLPLDEYMEKAQFFELSENTAVIMEAGRTEKGQMVIPFSYTFPVTFFMKEDLPQTQQVTTWDEMVNGVLYLQAAAAKPQGGNAAAYIAAPFGALADYAGKQLLFTEEELLSRINEMLALEKLHENGQFQTVPNYFQWNMCVNFEYQNHLHGANYSGANDPDYIPDLMDEQTNTDDDSPFERTQNPLTMIPVYSDDGGISATIFAFGAVSANTDRADDAFFVLDYLMKRSYQCNSNFHVSSNSTYWTIPVYDNLMTDENPMQKGWGWWSMSEENYSEFQKLRNQITNVKFAGTFELEIEQLYYDCLAAQNGETSKSTETLVHEAYSRMKQELSE